MRYDADDTCNAHFDALERRASEPVRLDGCDDETRTRVTALYRAARRLGTAQVRHPELTAELTDAFDAAYELVDRDRYSVPDDDLISRVLVRADALVADAADRARSRTAQPTAVLI